MFTIRSDFFIKKFYMFFGQPQGLSQRIVFHFVVYDAHIVQPQCVTLFACGESVRRGHRTLRICREFVRF